MLDQKGMSLQQKSEMSKYLTNPLFAIKTWIFCAQRMGFFVGNFIWLAQWHLKVWVEMENAKISRSQNFHQHISFHISTASHK